MTQESNPPMEVNSLEDYVGYSTDMVLSHWSPRGRLIGAFLGGLMMTQAVRSRGAPRWLLSVAGCSLLLRAFTNLEMMRLIGLVAAPAIRLRRTVMVGAPVDQVYAFWKDFSNFARFMSYVEKVEVNELGGIHWRVRGPAGINVEWDATVGAMVPNQKISWRSMPGSIVMNEGVVRLREAAIDRTLVEVELSYSSPAGLFGHVFAHLLGFDPRSRIDQDLGSMKEILESQHDRAKALSTVA